MPHQPRILHAGLPTAPTSRRRWARRLLLAAAAGVLGLLPVVQGLAPMPPATVHAAQAAQSAQSGVSSPPSGSSDTAPSTGTGPTHDALDNAVIFDPSKDDQLDIGAKLDQGAHLFSLEARYQDWGDGNDDYYLANGNRISHQPLSDLFAPLGEWLAAPEHAGQPVMVWLATDPRSANPERFDAACKAFQDSLGQYLLKSSDLPDGKTLGELAPDELAATLQMHPLVLNGWSDCTGDQLFPTAAASTAPAPAAASGQTYEHWMADLGQTNQTFLQRPLRQVIIPGSHDAGTWDWGDWVSQDKAQAQNQDITHQLDAGSRYFDLRAGYWDWNDPFVSTNGPDYWTAAWHVPLGQRAVA